MCVCMVCGRLGGFKKVMMFEDFLFVSKARLQALRQNRRIAIAPEHGE